MRILGKEAAPMYLWAILLLSLVAVLKSYQYGTFPTNLVISVAVTEVFDILVKRYYSKQGWGISYQGIISGLIIGSIAPFNSSPLVVIVGDVVAILSKTFMRIRGFHIFNPATFGLIVSLSLFSLGDAWWAAEGLTYGGMVIALTPLLAIANYSAGKLGVAMPFLAVIAALIYSTRFADLLAISYYFYFAFIMVSEPKTSPYGIKQQLVFGIGVAILSFLLTSYGAKYPLFIALLTGNLLYFLYRTNFLKAK